MREQKREKERSGQNQRENATIEFEKLRRHCPQIRDEIKGSLWFPIEHDRLREKNSIAVDSEARSQSRCFNFQFIPYSTKIGQALLARNLETGTYDLGHCFQSSKNLGGSTLVLKHYRRGAIVSCDLTDYGQFMGRLLPQSIGLEAEQSCKRQE